MSRRRIRLLQAKDGEIESATKRAREEAAAEADARATEKVSAELLENGL